MFIVRIRIATIPKTTNNNIMASAAAAGYCSRARLLFIARPTDALCPPDIACTVMKSPIIRLTTKIVPIAIPGRHKGMITLIRIWKLLAPISCAASIMDQSIRIMELKIGTNIKSVYKCTKANITAKSE